MARTLQTESLSKHEKLHGTVGLRFPTKLRWVVASAMYRILYRKYGRPSRNFSLVAGRARGSGLENRIRGATPTSATCGGARVQRPMQRPRGRLWRGSLRASPARERQRGRQRYIHGIGNETEVGLELREFS